MKKIYYFAAMAAMLAACSSDDLTVKESTPQVVEDGAVMFDVYTNRSLTRAGEIGEFTTNGLKAGAFKDDGFGVFGYYTNSSTYDQQAIPNFFYNQQVKYGDGGYFEYAPIKYWPNEFGTTAQSEDADKVSFFAYAPYIEVVPATGKPTAATTEEAAELQKWGINCLTRNNATGDPMVKYIASFDQAKSVDLCWGVCDDTDWRIIQTGGVQGDLTEGYPWLNVQRPADATALGAATGQKVKFTFKHATAQLMVNIDAFVDGITNANEIAAGTKVYVRAISFEGLATKGTLNLNNAEANKAYWLDYNGTNDLNTGESVTIYDGRKDGKEGTPSGIATNEKALGFNPNLIQSTIWGAGDEKPGVTKTPQALFCNGDAAATLPIYVIPTGDPVKVTITYDIETADENLSTYVSDLQQHGNSIENVITKEISFGGETAMENGKSYVINLHLGMNSVKFDAAVTEWVVAAAADVHLPANAPTASVAAGESATVTVPASASNGIFQVSGLTPTETATIALATLDGSTDPTSMTVGSDGMAKCTYTINPNMSISDIDGTLTITDESSNVGTLNITQKAHALDLTVSAVADKSITVAVGTGVTGMSNTEWATATMTRTRGGSTTDVTLTATSDGVLKFADAVAAGDVYTITVNPGAGKAPAETITAKIGGIAFVPNAYSIEYGETGFKPAPTVSGETPTGYTYSITGVADIVTVVPESGVITTVAPGTTEVQAVATQADNDEYKCTDASKTATYTLTVTKAVGTISYFVDNVPSAAITASSEVADIATAVLKNSHNTVLEAGATKGGAVTYSILSVNGDTGDTTTFTIADGKLKVGTAALAAGTTYTIQLKASVEDNANVAYANNSATVTITVTTAP